MNVQKLYQKLDQDFELERLKDDWKEMDFNEYISENFKKRYMGLVLDNSEEIFKVYTAVFPSDEVLQKILNFKEKDILLFTHHPMDWNIMGKEIFKNIPRNFLQKLKENKINIIGATHYSTEKFACMAMLDYFKQTGLPAEFIEGNPDLNDLE